MIFGINTTSDISKLSQISLAQRLVKLRITIFTRGIYANITTNHAIAYTNSSSRFRDIRKSLKVQIFNEDALRQVVRKQVSF